MKVLIIYDTYFGNTQRVAELVKEQFTKDQAELIKIDILTQDKIDKADMVILGSPTRAFNMTAKMKKGIRKYKFANKHFWTFDTRSNIQDLDSKFLLCMINRFGYAAEKMQRKLQRKGAKKAADCSYYYVKDTEGPLYDDVVEKIQKDTLAIQDI